jgi:hypothetical protein
MFLLTEKHPAVAVIEKAIAKLPKTSEGIARSLRQRKITGERGDPRTCPVAVYLNKALANGGFVGYYTSVVGPWGNIYNSDGDPIGDFNLPVTVDEFVSDFDSGMYSYLLPS